MAKKVRKKITTVHQHPRHVPVSKKNPDGITIVGQHLRRLHGTYLDQAEIESIYKSYDRNKLNHPTPDNLDFENGNQFDEIIAIWTDYFNKKFNANPPLDPNIIKALIASESGFDVNIPRNQNAIGIAQITIDTWKILQNPNGEAKEFIFSKIRQRDLKNPSIAIPMATRWLFRKRETAASKLNRSPTPDELILEYKGLLRSRSDFKKSALKNFRINYDKLKKK